LAEKGKKNKVLRIKILIPFSATPFVNEATCNNSDLARSSLGIKAKCGCVNLIIPSFFVVY